MMSQLTHHRLARGIAYSERLFPPFHDIVLRSMERPDAPKDLSTSPIRPAHFRRNLAAVACPNAVATDLLRTDGLSLIHI